MRPDRHGELSKRDQSASADDEARARRRYREISTFIPSRSVGGGDSIRRSPFASPFSAVNDPPRSLPSVTCRRNALPLTTLNTCAVPLSSGRCTSQGPRGSVRFLICDGRAHEHARAQACRALAIGCFHQKCAGLGVCGGRNGIHPARKRLQRRGPPRTSAAAFLPSAGASPTPGRTGRR